MGEGTGWLTVPAGTPRSLVASPGGEVSIAEGMSGEWD